MQNWFVGEADYTLWFKDGICNRPSKTLFLSKANLPTQALKEQAGPQGEVDGAVWFLLPRFSSMK